jgi:hypothetical protein
MGFWDSHKYYAHKGNEISQPVKQNVKNRKNGLYHFVVRPFTNLSLTSIKIYMQGLSLK